MLKSSDRGKQQVNWILSGYKDQQVTFVLSAYEVKNNNCLFGRLFKVKKSGVFLFGISFLFRFLRNETVLFSV